MSEGVRLSAASIAHQVEDVRRVTLALIADLSDEQLELPYLATVNPMRWELGHIGFFFDSFLLSELDSVPTSFKNGTDFFDSFEVDHVDRWSLDLPPRNETLAYLDAIKRRALERLAGHEPTARESYHYQLAIHHESMHAEALAWTRQTMGYACPSIELQSPVRSTVPGGQHPGDVRVDAQTFRLGAEPARDGEAQRFVFDNEKWAHPVELPGYEISRAPVTNREFSEFVKDAGYARRECWSTPGWVWRTKAESDHPGYWKVEDGTWLQRVFDQWVPLMEDAPVVHVGWYEAEAYCRWAGRRLPSEAEWECAASTAPGDTKKRLYPWGDEAGAMTRERANLDYENLGCVDVACYPEGDSGWGCRQMSGNIWEWTASAFYPYPGFVVDTPYREYSAPWFGYPKVLKGGTWATRSRLVTNTYRNFFEPGRRDVFAGFRTCANE
ncbi:MAG: ergothioneine biosynthesis protein EgtB [Myxococcales bacterium]|nr:ergothioneine biosynthesis protein EgtB [Myxococcales bacterium]